MEVLALKVLARLLEQWSEAWKKAHPALSKLIGQANFDLYYGPIQDGAYGDPAEDNPDWSDYPGFQEATNQISDGLQDLPSRIWIDVECEQVLLTEPIFWIKCEVCEGEGKIFDQEEDGSSLITRCDACRGEGGNQDFNDCYEISRQELIQEIVGKELAQYI